MMCGTFRWTGPTCCGGDAQCCLTTLCLRCTAVGNRTGDLMETRRYGLVLLCLWLSRAEITRDTQRTVTRNSAPSPRHRGDRAVVQSSFESWSSSSDPSPVSTHAFISQPSGGRYVYGRLAVVRDPLRSLSVLEPGRPGGCGLKLLVPAAQTALSGGCEVAVNAGFYNASSGQCLGHVISGGRVVRSGGGLLNAQFGIRSDGSLVFGYLSEEEVQQQRNPFVQLVSGVVWLLRDGQVYINHSLQVESDQNQSMKVFREFADMLSARTAVGHDANGSVVLLQVDGETQHRGMSLWEVADFLKQNGVINAVNLDGGGSSSFILNGTLASYPPDPCVADSRWRCGRPVSTVLCVHRRRCEGCRPYAHYLPQPLWLLLIPSCFCLWLVARPLLQALRSALKRVLT